jgi:hypothetical protein
MSDISQVCSGRTTLVRNLFDGQYEDPACIVAFNTAEGWSRDVTGTSPTTSGWPVKALDQDQDQGA